jgi:hypothetical protein
MAWQDEAVPLLRALLDDLDEPPRVADDRLERLAAAAARLVQGELGAGAGFAADAGLGDITPDPSDPALGDPAFMHLLVLKAACLAERGAAAQAAAGAVAFSDAGTSVDTRTAANARLALLGNGSACQAYADAADRYRRGLTLGLAICTPPGGWLFRGGWGRR